jgi:hypothetical protein
MMPRTASLHSHSRSNDLGAAAWLQRGAGGYDTPGKLERILRILIV